MSSYIAGLNLRMTNGSGIEELLTLTTVSSLIYAYQEQFAVAVVAKKEGGNIKALPKSFFARIVTPVHFVAMFATPVAFLVGVTFNGFSQPSWLSQYNLPVELDQAVGPGGKAVIRGGAMLASLVVWKAMSVVFKYLGSQWHYLGLREKPKIVSTGPYSIVRHPLYTGFLAQELVQIPMYWSYAPFIAFLVTLAALVIKIPIEESVIENDAIIGNEYKAYKRKVTSRVIPGIW
ncbi:hypothetical protein BD779DRAFT_1444470 [Infundibulicybe gibba]|nr:hypothetical protein BD779DRAFT_1444470 [Infundibulicybe gibba]